jgi:hypothetical protein
VHPRVHVLEQPMLLDRCRLRAYRQDLGSSGTLFHHNSYSTGIGHIMPMENFTKHQQSIIKNYYKNRDDVAFQRAQELLTDLYLSEGKKREKVWESLFTNLERIGVPADQLERIKKERKPEIIAKLLEKKL